MTLRTGHFEVCAFQHKTCGPVIERTGLPVSGIVTSAAICFALLLKLIPMGMLMACRTCRIQSGENHLSLLTWLVIGQVTCRASLLLMGTLQLPSGQAVREAHGLPAFGLMTTCARLVRVILIFNTTGMDIFMTVHAAGADFPEGPVIVFEMAGKAGCCEMRPG